MTRALAVLALVLALAPRTAFADCASTAEPGESANKKHRVEPTWKGEVKVLGRDDEKKAWEKRHEGKLETVPGHHLKTLVADDGQRFVLVDKYGGVTIHDMTGKLIRALAPADLLSKNELRARPGSWPCHEEGVWGDADAAATLAADSKTLTLVLYTKKKVTLDLATGKFLPEGEARWVKEGECKTPDAVKAHGGMNCVAQAWTCPRCKKEQNDLVWEICPACAKELGVCIVCRKKVAKK